ncbi:MULTISPECIES: glycosyltransferase [unclassified Duganella]|uniref:O-linked N-acetylglucosamine transferase family protein n=1 Tax=unclassified Duganella TaxID=2636909 RepID=UPI000E3533A9|nr:MULTISPECIES: glycosyltransferase [unclassified Duganella]RFP08066.1 glycosyltransferase [Duganella sp. BJB475]RFP23871.1 glycosyltransferase [Duganella sp. BJB476]
MSAQLNAAIAAGNIAEAATLAFAQAGLGVLPITELIGIAGLLAAQGRPEQAIALYQLWIKHCDTPLLHAAWYNLAVLQMQGGEQRAAERSYRRALEIQPHFTEAYLGLGALMERRRSPDEALDTWHEALDLLDPAAANAGPLQIQLFNNIGRVADGQRRYPEAEEALTRSLQLDPRQPLVVAHWIRLRQRQCAWPVLAALPGLDEEQLLAAASAPTTLAASDDPAQQLAAARRHVAAHAPRGAAALSDQAGYTHRKLRIGYLAPDACLQTAELYALHDRKLVEVYGFCWNEEDHAPARLRMVQGMDHHLRIDGVGDLQAAQLIRAHEIDILVDLCGLAVGGRPGILTHRPAPVQIAWLGYPGTTALDCIDYVLADAWVLPPALAPYFTEQPLYLPDTLHISDRQRPKQAAMRAKARARTRAASGLPADAFVFCCFADSHHLAPQQFAAWMRILQRVPDSVLWLATDSEQARDNLRVAALHHGVSSERLCFVAQPPAHDMACHQAADLFLDTLPFNAGDAASDALWAGLPVLTCSGRSYAGRTGGSLLHAAGLPELVTEDLRDYEDTAVRLAQAQAELAALRRRLADSRRRGGGNALFDTPRFVRNLEQLYQRVARGTLKRRGGKQSDAESARHADASLPLVSILVAAGDADADALERTLRSALAQDWGHTEIIVGDSTGGDTLRARVAPLLARHPQLRYHRAPGLAPAASLDHCLALSLGEYIAVAPQGDVLHPEKLARMMQFYQSYPNVGLVGSWRQPRDDSGAALPGAPVFSADTVVDGASLGTLLLSSDHHATATLCDAGALLLRRSIIGAGFGHFQGRQYRYLSGIALALSALAGRDGVYLAEPLSSHRPIDVNADAAPANNDADALACALDGLHLLYAAHAQHGFLADPAAFKQTLAARLAALNALLTSRHATLAAGAGVPLTDLHEVLRQGYQLLLSE